MQPLHILKMFIFLSLIMTASATYKWGRSKGFSLRRFTNQDVNVQNRSIHKSKHVFHDLPTKSDLKLYVSAMERIVKFSQEHKYDIDLNYAFGLFLMNVNLKSVLRFKHMNLPLMTVYPIRELVQKTSGLLNFYKSMVQKDVDSRNKRNKAIYALFSNDTAWVERVERYDTVFQTAPKKRSSDQLEAIYDSWEEYTKLIYDWEKSAVPSPKQSDYCISSLRSREHERRVDYSDEESRKKVQCSLPANCHKILMNGSDAGYALTHRLLLMMLARYGRGCSIFSPAKDKELTNRFCNAAYEEAQYIVVHHYKVMDLLLEQIAFCYIEGHAHFVNREWLSHALGLQTEYGCFQHGPYVGTRRSDSDERHWQLARPLQMQSIADGHCNSHVTAAAAAALAAGTRHIFSTSKRPLKHFII